MIVRELIALFGFETDEKSAKSVDEKLGGMADKLKKLAVVAGAGLAINFFKSVAEGVAQLGDEIDTTAARIGIGTTALQELRFAADRADVTNEELAGGLRVLSKTAFDAATGGKESAETFARLGIRAKDAAGKARPLEELLPDVADALSKVTNNTERAALAQRILGRGGAALLPLFKDGAAGIQRFREEAGKFGHILDEDLIRLSSEWDDSQKDLGRTIQSVRNAIAKALLPVINRITDAFSAFIMEHRELINTGVTAFVRTLGAAVEGLVMVAVAVVDAFADWVEGLDGVSAKFLAVGAAAAGIAILLALPAGSILLLIALVGLLLEDFFAWRAGGESVIGDIIGWFQQLAEQFPLVFEVLSELVGIWTSTFSGMLGTVASFVTFWIDLFTVGPAQAFEGLAASLTATWGELWKTLTAPVVTAIDFWRQKLGELVTWVMGNPIVKALLNPSAALASLPGIGGMMSAFRGAGGAPVATGSPAGGVTNSQQNKIDIAVDASGSNNPEEIAVAVSRQVELVLDRQHRDAMGDLAIAGGQ